MEGAEGYFHVSEEAMKTDMQAHKFIEYGRHQQYLYGIKSDNVLEVIDSGRMVVLEVYPQVRELMSVKWVCHEGVSSGDVWRVCQVVCGGCVKWRYVVGVS